MLKYVEDVDQLAESAIRVEHFATRDLIEAEGSDIAVEVGAWMVANDFDVAPIGRVRPFRYIVQEEVLGLAPHSAVGEIAREVPTDQLIEPGAPLGRALDLLHVHGWLFMSRGETVEGVVTRHDLARPAVSLYVLARVITIEHGLRRLLGTYTSTPMPDAPPATEERAGLEYLAGLLKCVGVEEKLRKDLKFGSRNAFAKATGSLVKLRNALAHGRGILSIEDSARGVVERLRRLNGLHAQVVRLVNEREQVWEAYENTHLVSREVAETTFSGPNAVSLPLPAPLHVVTACNPFEQVLSDEENERRSASLRRVLIARGLDFHAVLGVSPNRTWVEQSFAVAGISRSEACELAHRFGQRAIFELDENECLVVDVMGKVRSRTIRSRDV